MHIYAGMWKVDFPSKFKDLQLNASATAKLLVIKLEVLE